EETGQQFTLIIIYAACSRICIFVQRLVYCTYLLLRELQEGREYCLRFCELSLLSRGS
ncbi:hypothetical protein CMV_011497, partial [Castanea mollissima]